MTGPDTCECGAAIVAGSCSNTTHEQDAAIMRRVRAGEWDSNRIHPSQGSGRPLAGRDVVTADTITDAQIDDLLDAGLISQAMFEFATRVCWDNRDYRDQCARIFNALLEGRIAAAEITDDQLQYLFARHCACRPLDLSREEDDHAAIHDCDTGILHDIRVALGRAFVDDVSSTNAVEEAVRGARARCAEHLRVDTERAARKDAPR